MRGLTPDAVARIAVRLRAAEAPKRRRAWVLALAGIVLILSAGSALAWATDTLQRLPVIGAILAPRARVPHTSPSHPHAAQPPSDPSFPAGPTTAETGRARPEPAKAEATDDLRRRAVRHPLALQDVATAPAERSAGLGAAGGTAASPSRAPAEPAAESPIVEEGTSFARVLRLWRQERDDRSALSALDSHDRRFARGEMALESRLLRVEILLSSHRDREALAILDGLPVDEGHLPRGRELLTVRGELRIAADRCQDGRADLARIATGSDELADRARNALTHCR